MLTLYRHADCPNCEEVAGELKRLRLAHQVHIVPAETLRSGAETLRSGAETLRSGGMGLTGVPADAVPPILTDGEAVCVGREAIDIHLAELVRIKDRWQQHGADACYCDPDGEIL